VPALLIVSVPPDQTAAFAVMPARSIVSPVAKPSIVAANPAG
jgi:hypothetical protein